MGAWAHGRMTMKGSDLFSDELAIMGAILGSSLLKPPHLFFIPLVD